MNIHEVYTTKVIEYSNYYWKAFIENEEIRVFVERKYKDDLLYLEISFETSDDIIKTKPSMILGALFDTITEISKTEYLSAVILKAKTNKELKILKQTTSNLFSRFGSYTIEDNNVILYNKYFFHKILQLEINWIKENDTYTADIDILGKIFETTIKYNKGLYYVSVNNKDKEYFKTNKENIEILGHYIMKYINTTSIDNIVIKINNNTLFFESKHGCLLTQQVGCVLFPMQV